MLRPRRATVLIVEDDLDVSRTFARILSMHGYEVLQAADAQTGLRETAATKPDVILLDLRMPLMDGVRFLRELRTTERDRHTPVAIVTGDYFIDESISTQIAALDASLYFKPLWLEDLICLTERLLGRVH